jgi:hypothetical protein
MRWNIALSVPLLGNVILGAATIASPAIAAPADVLRARR